MADWRNISDTEVDPDAPVTSELAYAFRDNVIASFEGASGAPRLQDAALDDVAANATSRGMRWVTRRNAIAPLGGIGTYAMLVRASLAPTSPGVTVAGSELSYSNAAGGGGVSPSGSWMCVGQGQAGSLQAACTMFLRVS